MILVRLRSRWFAGGLVAAGCSLLNSGCAATAAQRADVVLPASRLAKLPPSAPQPAQTSPIAQVKFQPALPETLPQLPKPEPSAVEQKIVPISLDTVLHLAEEQNAQIAIARAQLRDSETEQRLADLSWLPKVNAGVGYNRYEGGIQDFSGSLLHTSMSSLYPGMEIRGDFDLRDATFQRVNAERNAWQQRGEASKVTSETLLEAATTYFDLLTARRGETVAHELEKYFLDVQKRTEKMVTPDDRSAQVLVEAASAERSGRLQAIAKLHQQGDAAAAKLAYLLGLGTCVQMVPVEQSLKPIDLVDPTPPLSELVARAVANGPGVRELESLLATIQEGRDRLNGPMSLAPVVSVVMGEDLIGAGPGSRMSFDNRWDMCVQVRWNLMEFVTEREKRRLADSKVEQARISRDDLRAKLAAGVQEARDASLSGREQIRHAADQVRYAANSYRLVEQRLKMTAPTASPAELMLAIRGLEAAQYNHLTAINAYNKAQIRLLVLLGPDTAKGKCAAPSQPQLVVPHQALRPEIQ